MIKTFENFNSKDLSKEMEGYYHDLIDDAKFEIDWVDGANGKNHFTLFGNEEGHKDLIEEFVERIEDMEEVVVIKNHPESNNGDVYLICFTKTFLKEMDEQVKNWNITEIVNDEEGVWIGVERATQALIFIDPSSRVYINSSFVAVVSERNNFSREAYLGFMKYYVKKYYKKYITTTDISTYSSIIPKVPKRDITRIS
jgi:hypothetical protein